MPRNQIAVSRTKENVLIKIYDYDGREVRQEFKPKDAAKLADKILRQVQQVNSEKYVTLENHERVRRR
jgi:hypothetical protein